MKYALGIAMFSVCAFFAQGQVVKDTAKLFPTIYYRCSVAHFDSVGRVYSCGTDEKGYRRFYNDTTVKHTPEEWAKICRAFIDRINRKEK